MFEINLILIAQTLALCLSSGAVALIGDAIGRQDDVRKRPYLRVMVDNGTHGLVGALSWGAVTMTTSSPLTQISGMILAGVLSSFLDIDHFLMARSYRLESALSLPSRPPFHSTTIIPVLFIIINIIQRWWTRLSMAHIDWMFLVSWLSHQLRDANRRGLWFWPFGSTPPLPTWNYVSCTILLPLVVKMFLPNTDQDVT